MRVGIFGAGAIGGTVAGRLAHGGHEVRLVGRPRIRAALAEGLTLSRWGSAPVTVPGASLPFVDDASGLVDCDLVVITVKSGDATEAADALATALPPSVPWLSLQNGLDAVEALRAAAPERTIWPGLVPFNVVWSGPAHLHQGTSGPLVVPPALEAFAAAVRQGDGHARTHRDVRAVQWGKLLLNLNNAVNALAGRPLRAQLSDRAYRRILSDVMREGQRVLDAAGIRWCGVGRIRPGLAPYVLRLPDLVFFRVASALIAIDPEARSSMLDDLDRGRRTEVDHLNGAIVRLAEAAGVDAPLQRALVAAVHAAEAAGGSPRLDPHALRAALYQP